MPYIYNDEDNAPMFLDDAALYHDTSRFKNEEEEQMADPWTGAHNPTVYMSRSEMEAAKRGELDVPFSDPPQDGCWNCLIYNGDYCTKLWNNLDECYKDTDRDAREPSDICDDWEHDESAVWEQFFGFEED